MPIITKSNVSGNWNATTSWVGGVVPTSVDDVIFNGTSAGVILNVNSTVKSLDMTGFTDMFTQSANLVIQGSTNSTGQDFTTGQIMILDGGYKYTSGLLGMSSGNKAIKQNDTTTRFVYDINLANIYLRSNLYFIGGRFSINGVTNMYMGTHSLIVGDGGVDGFLNFPARSSRRLQNAEAWREDNIIIDCDPRTLYTSSGIWDMGVKLVSGILRRGLPQNFGDLATPDGYWGFTGLKFISNVGSTASFIQTGGTMSEMAVGVNASVGTFIYNVQHGIDYFMTDYVGSGASIIRLDSTLNTKYLSHYHWSNFAGFNQTTNPVEFTFTGTGGVSASFYLPTPVTYYATLNNTPGFNKILYYSPYPTYRFTSDATHKIGKFYGIGLNSDIIADTNQANIYGTFSSQTASIPVTIQLGQTGFVYGYGFKDINFTNNQMIVIDGSLENTTGATTSFPTGGGGGGSTETSNTFII